MTDPSTMPPDVRAALTAAWERVKAENPPTVTITRSGRWSYFLVLTDALTRHRDWIVIGSVRRARKVARRKLNRYKRVKARDEGFGEECLR